MIPSAICFSSCLCRMSNKIWITNVIQTHAKSNREHTLLTIVRANSSQWSGLFEQQLPHADDVWDWLESSMLSPSKMDTITPDSAGLSNARQVKKLSSSMTEFLIPLSNHHIALGCICVQLPKYLGHQKGFGKVACTRGGAAWGAQDAETRNSSKR